MLMQCGVSASRMKQGTKLFKCRLSQTFQGKKKKQTMCLTGRFNAECGSQMVFASSPLSGITIISHT